MTAELANRLKEVDSIEVTTLMDNYIDILLKNSPGVTRPPLAIGEVFPTDTMLSEHGLSLLITVKRGTKSHCILLDCGYSNIGVPHNMQILQIDPKQIEAIVISHAHMDHTGALYPLIESIMKPIPLVVHPEVFTSPRFFGLDDGKKLRFPQTLIKEELESKGLEIVEESCPSLLADSMIAVTGEVERVTEFEKGLPNTSIERDGKIEHDMILDDQSLVIKLKEKGLVVVSGCAHAGIINTAFYAKKITGSDRIHAILGGFHLTGPVFEPITEKTITEFKKMEPEVIIPMHCTGWKAMKRFSEEFPSSFILNSVGTAYVFQ